MKRPEILVIGGSVGTVVAYLAGRWVDGLMGDTVLSLYVSMLVVLVITLAFGVPSALLAMRSGKNK